MLFIPKTKAKWNRVCLLPKKIHTWMWTWSSQGAHLRFGCSFRISVGAILDLAESYHPPAVHCWFASCHLSALLQSQLFKHSSHLLLRFYEAPHFFPETLCRPLQSTINYHNELLSREIQTFKTFEFIFSLKEHILTVLLNSVPEKVLKVTLFCHTKIPNLYTYLSYAF